MIRRVGSKCADNPMKCTALVTAAGYTAFTLVENWGEQTDCVQRCVPPNWQEVVDSNGNVAPEYFGVTPSPDADDQPQCIEGMDCEQFCVAKCKAEHPTTLFGAATEGVGEMMDDMKDFAQEGLGIPVDGIVTGLTWTVGLVILGVVLYVLRRAYVWVRNDEKKQRIVVLNNE